MKKIGFTLIIFLSLNTFALATDSEAVTSINCRVSGPWFIKQEPKYFMMEDLGFVDIEMTVLNEGKELSGQKKYNIRSTEIEFGIYGKNLYIYLTKYNKDKLDLNFDLVKGQEIEFRYSTFFDNTKNRLHGNYATEHFKCFFK